MSLHSENRIGMTCAEFEDVFDRYVDETLDPRMTEAARFHVGSCRACELEVTRWQQTRILLSTAVADFAAAVDVSTLRSDIEAALGRTADRVERVGSMREAVTSRRDRAGRSANRRGSQGDRRSVPRRGVAAAARFISAAAVSAVAAAAAVMFLSPNPDASRTVVASATPVASPASYQAAAFLPGSRNAFGDIAPVTYTPPPLARPEVSRVDGLEAAAGHLVSTWVQPGTNARVIWVQDRGVGAPVRTAGLGR